MEYLRTPYTDEELTSKNFNENVDINSMDNGFLAVGRERGTMKILDDTFDVAFRTSRTFIKEGEEFKQVHHHGSFDDLNMQNKIMKALALLS